MAIWIVLLTVWSTNVTAEIGRTYASEDECLAARSTMAIRHGSLVCQAATVPGA